jgi:hypothetical protein
VSEIAARVRIGSLPIQSSAQRVLALASRHRRLLQVVLALGLYFGFACYLTWPAITDLGRIYYGGRGDPVGAMASYRELVDHHHNPFLPGTISQLAAPEGQPIPWARDLAAMPSVLTQFLLTAAFGQIAAYGLYGLLGYTLSGVMMFLFVRRLTENLWVALLCGWAFAFYPFAVINGTGHDDYIHGWVLVLAVWRLVELQWLPTRRNAVLAGFAVALGMWWTPYFILFGGVAYAATLIPSLALAWRDHRLRVALPFQATTAAIVVVFLGLLASLSLGQSGNSLGVRTNSLAEFNTYSARPLEYMLPDVNSPLFGSDTSGYLTSHLHGSNFSEAMLYLGVTIILLALAACIAVLRRKLPPRVSRAAIVLAAVALAGLITSAPPEGTIFGVVIPFPSHFIMKLTTTWRAYSRFVIVVMLGFTALAGIGLHALTRGHRLPWRVAVMLFASVLVPLDLWSRVRYTNTYDAPAVYKVLAREPRGLTAEYPLTPSGYNLYLDVFFQNVHGMPMINGYLQGSPQERRAVALANLANPSTGPRLAALGVRYVILDAAPPLHGLPPPGTPGRGFRLIFRDVYASLYAVTARPAGPGLPADGDGFDDDETGPGGTVFNWLGQPRGTIEFAGVCPACKGILGMTVAPFARPRVVTISAGSRVLLVRRITVPTRLEIPVRFGATPDVTISATPRPQSIAKTAGGSDTRSVSIQVSDLTFTWPRLRTASDSHSPLYRAPTTSSTK